MKYCNKCGAEVTGSEKFCRKCGVNINHQQESKPEYVNRVISTSGWKKKLTIVSVVFLLLALVFISYQYYFYHTEYNTYYGKYKVEESEKIRYINLYNTEKTSKESEIEKRRQAESGLADIKATLQAKYVEISNLEGVLSDEQKTKISLQSELSSAEQTSSSQSQQLQTVQKEVKDITICPVFSAT